MPRVLKKHPRCNRVAVMLSDVELKKVRAYARKHRVPVSTAAYQLLAASLKR